VLCRSGASLHQRAAHSLVRSAETCT
jgi:hypothetical protein